MVEILLNTDVLEGMLCEVQENWQYLPVYDVSVYQSSDNTGFHRY